MKFPVLKCKRVWLFVPYRCQAIIGCCYVPLVVAYTAEVLAHCLYTFMKHSKRMEKKHSFATLMRLLIAKVSLLMAKSGRYQLVFLVC